MDREEAARIQTLEQQVVQLNNQLGQMKQSMYSLEGTMNELENYEKMSEGERESFVLLGNGVFVKGKVNKQDTVYVDVVGGVVLEKKIKDAITILKKRQDKIKTNMGELEKGIAELQKVYTDLLKKINKREKNV
jgi:prefoldin alpha subunit